MTDAHPCSLPLRWAAFGLLVSAASGQTTQFAEVVKQHLPSDREASAAIAFGDVDGDGDLDALFGNDQSPNRLYVNRLRQVTTPFVARLGAPYRLDLHARAGFAHPGQTVVGLVGLAPAVPPLQIPPFGALGLSPAGLAALPQLLVPAPSGEVVLAFTVPANAGLAGQTLYWQALVLHGADPSTWRFTNVVADVVLP